MAKKNASASITQPAIQVPDEFSEILGKLAGAMPTADLDSYSYNLIVEKFLSIRAPGRSLIDELGGIHLRISEVKAEADQLHRRLMTGNNIREWQKYISENPPSADAIAYLVMIHEDHVRAQEAATSENKDRARTASARKAIEKKTADGTTMTAKATKMLEDRQRRGDNVMESHVTAQIAKALGCSQRLVSKARTQLLAQK